MVGAVGGTVLVLGGFVVHATWAATEGAHHERGPCLPPLQGAGWRARAPATHDARHSEGNYHRYLEDLRRWKGADSDQPHRIAYKEPVRT